MNDHTFGPQEAPQDYRIANRPNNPNWRGVKAWFDEVANQTPYHERATIHIPCCPKCDAKDFNVTPDELADAEGVIACEYCDTLINPDNIPAAQVWSSADDRAGWKQEAMEQIAAAAEDMLAAYNAEAEARKARMGSDYWDRRLEREQHAPVAGVPRNRGLAGI